jgi:hypothetical protein
LQRVSADENLHMIFYRDVSEAVSISRERAMGRFTACCAASDAGVHRAKVPAQGRDHRRRHLTTTHPATMTW